MRVAFVGMQRKLSTLPPDYLWTFVQFHLEIPYYYARDGGMDVVVTYPDEEFAVDNLEMSFPLGGGKIRLVSESRFQSYNCDIVIHWRKWFPELKARGGFNLMLSQDHSYSSQTVDQIQQAWLHDVLDGLLVFPGWHHQNCFDELQGIIPFENMYSGCTLGVDTDIYCPAVEKDPYHLLWASDPGRGLDQTIDVFFGLRAFDHRYHLTITYPDYVTYDLSSMPKHSNIEVIHGLRNSPKLWDIFNSAGVVPYASRFKEPSSRVHRQAQAAGCLVLYPPDMGTPSHLIENGHTGIVENINLWPQKIHKLVSSGKWVEIGKNAREMACRESWKVQAERFKERFGAQ